MMSQAPCTRPTNPMPRLYTRRTLCPCVATENGKVHAAKRSVDARDLLRRKRYLGGSKVFPQALGLAAARNGDDSRLVAEHPRERDLSHRRILFARKIAEKPERRAVLLAPLGRVLRHAITIVLRALELRLRTIRTG